MARKKAEEKEEIKETIKPELTFAKDDLLASSQFSPIEKDFLKAILENKEYSVSDAKALLAKKMKEAVK